MQAALLHRKFHFINIQEYRGLNLAPRAINPCIQDTWNRANNWRITLSLPRAVIFSATNPPDPRLDLAGYCKKSSPHRYHFPQTEGKGRDKVAEPRDGRYVRPIERTRIGRTRGLPRSKMHAYIRCTLEARILLLSDSKKDNSATDLGNCCGNGWESVRRTPLRGSLPS